ncbi:MAG TPA: segregation/condensation protein A [Oligoflexia bacterium]|nr:segregation/condensation protein A [Oligoflexia bacterium]HMR23901.1 segregation/condensation protein A [Oligoflexia bacterium]
MSQNNLGIDKELSPQNKKQNLLEKYQDFNSIMSAYQVHLDIFEGPLDLLLHLIKENELDIYNIPIAYITKQYLEYIEVMEELNLDIAGEFLLMAATLAHIKSKMLIPVEKNQDDDDEDGIDPREELVRRLLEYQKYKQAAQQLDTYYQLGRDVFTRKNQRIKIKVPSLERELAQVSIFKLVDAFYKILKKIERDNSYHEVNLEPIALSECIENISKAIQSSPEGSVQFHSLFKKAKSRLRVVVTFLALLDMIKRGALKVFQANTFSNIEIIGTPMLFEGWKHNGEDEYVG